jgi:hypothetical protein
MTPTPAKLEPIARLTIIAASTLSYSSGAQVDITLRIVPSDEIDEESLEILADPALMEELRRADRDVSEGRLVDGDEILPH